jgi:hypothetical protein
LLFVSVVKFFLFFLISFFFHSPQLILLFYVYIQLGKIKEGSPNIPGEFIREGLTAVVSVKVPEPEFEGQTKGRLGNPEIRQLVDSFVCSELSSYLEWNPLVSERASAMPFHHSLTPVSLSPSLPLSPSLSLCVCSGACGLVLQGDGCDGRRRCSQSSQRYGMYMSIVYTVYACVCMYMYVLYMSIVYECMHVGIHVCTVCIHVCTVCLYLCMHVYEYMYACMYVFGHTHVESPCISTTYHICSCILISVY